jgi:hypothetical protein
MLVAKEYIFYSWPQQLYTYIFFRTYSTETRQTQKAW